ncbi:CHAT domain-containing protein [Nostoc sp. DedSLP04]|uniref:CHAT domain-containing protein n=1 Tax=Nostoc sp. DedSLP04 TaxID=3075401 RepID=UPI002AD2B2C9|nr:tetratricopeptide repeat protein [Nostoc sp. DedSLP04]MDZ8034430.1 tetratricopeptide repeat protein [Nostoc sp. DedSLP04]
MSLRVRLVRLFTPPLLVLIPSLLPIPSELVSITAQAQTSQDRKAEADRLLQQGNQQFKRSQYKAAIYTWQQALAIYQELRDRNGKSKSLNNLGNAYNSQGEYAKAIEFFQQSLVISRDIGDRNGESNSLGNLGNAYNSLGQYAKAIEFFQQSLVISRDIGDRNGESKSLNNLGNAYNSQGEYAKAIEFFQQSLVISRDIGDRNGESNSLIGLGNAYDSLGQYALTIKFFQQSLVISRDIGDRNGESNSLIGLGIVYDSLGQYTKAIEFYQQSLVISRDIGDRNGESKSLGNLGIAYDYLGQYSKAIEFYQQSLVISRDIGDRNGEGATLSNLGSAHYSLGQYAKAIEFYQQSLVIKRDIGDRNGESKSLGNLGNAYNSLGQYTKAIEFYQQSLVISRDIGDRNGESALLNNLGSAHYSLGQYAKAIEFYQQSLVISRDIGDREGEGLTLANIGSTLEKQKQSELAIVFYKQSVNVRENIRQDIRKLPREQQESYTQTVAGSYRRLADLLLSQGRVLEAQQVLELLKIQELRDYTRDTRAGGETQGSSLTPVESRVIPPFNNLVNLGLKLTECERKPPYCPEHDQLRALRDQANAEFNKEADKLRALAKQQRQRDPAQIQQEELTVAAQKIVQSQPKTVLIYPLVLEDKLWLVWGTQAGKQGVVFNSKLVPVGRKELATTVVEFRQLLEQPGDVKELQKVSQKLYQWLVAPLRAELDTNNIQNLVFSLDRSTRYIPMAALFDGKKYLIESFNISTILTAGLTDTSDRLSPKIENDPVLALGLSEQFGNFKSLPNVKDEINGIIRSQTNPNGIYPGLSLINKDFTKDAFKYLIDHRILHIATHAQFISQNPDDSFLLLGDGNSFKIPEVKNLTDLGGIHLVVLSACETARGGEDKEGIEVSGLSYYFLTSGAKSVIASLWLVNDASTSQLMRYFYQNLATGKITKTEALRQAQLMMIVGKNQNSDTKDRSSVRLTPGNSGQAATISRDLSHPYYWAPFILIGNGL